jgi:ABC-type taurine transport system ATPase subunit
MGASGAGKTSLLNVLAGEFFGIFESGLVTPHICQAKQGREM